MAKVVWAEPALDQLDEIAEYIALDNPVAAGELVAKVFKKVDRLEQFPDSGREPPELPDSIYREVICNPCRIFYRREGNSVLIIHVMRDEMQLKKYLLSDDFGSSQQSPAVGHRKERIPDSKRKLLAAPSPRCRNIIHSNLTE